MLDRLADGREATSSELRAEIAPLEGSIAYGEGKSWGGQVAVGPRVLTTLSAAGHIVRASNDGGWTTSRPRWTSMRSWLGAPLVPPTEAEGTAALVEQWLRAFGPGTVTDLKWWLGSTVKAVQRALADIDAVEVHVDGQAAYLLGDDTDYIEPVSPWAALLPPLDPTTMGWFERAWYLGAAQGAAVRQQRQCWADGVVGRTDRRRLAPARRPAKSSCSCSTTSVVMAASPSRTRPNG